MREYTILERYRPQTLDEVVGQPRAVAILRGLLEQHKTDPYVWPQLVFMGPAATGKTSLARILAREFYGSEDDPDFLDSNASKQRKVDDLEDLLEDWCIHVPEEGHPFKLAFLDEADRFSPTAQDFLKRQIEDSHNVRFILAVNHPTRLTPEIRSRCGTVSFSPLSDASVGELLDRVIAGEAKRGRKLELDPETRKKIIRIARGDCRRATYLLTMGMDVERWTRMEGLVDKALPALLEGTIEQKILTFEPLLQAIHQDGWETEEVLELMEYRIMDDPKLPNDRKARIFTAIGEVQFRASQVLVPEMQFRYWAYNTKGM